MIWRCVVCAKSCKSDNDIVANSDSASLRACLVDGDPEQLHRARRTRRRSLLLSVLVQIGILAALILIPILSKSPRIALANPVPLPPYRHPNRTEPPPVRQPHVPRTHQLTFCLVCPPVLTTS